MASRKGGGGSGGGTGGGGEGGGGGGTGGGGGQRTLEMRVAELEDRISKLGAGGAQAAFCVPPPPCLICAMAPQQGTGGGAEGGAEGGAAAEGEARPCMAEAPKPCIAAGPTPCTIRPIYQQCIIWHCIIRCIINQCINECGGGCLPCAAGGGGSFGGFGF